ncbi:MAG TPA: NAD(P)-dependent oxidoreductase [Thermoleophilaceae bacterium]
MPEPPQTVAVLGTGIMGAPMARHIAGAGMRVRAWNRSREKADAIAGDGIDIAGLPAEAVESADVVVTMLADGDAVLSVMKEAIPAMRDDAVWDQMSTIGISATERVAALADEHRVTLVDAPALGTKEPAEKGELIVLASGPDEALDVCAPIFEAVGSRTIRVGDAGAGTRLKLVINNWLLGLVGTLAETIAFAQEIDVDPRNFLDAIDGGPLGPAYARLKGEMMIDDRFDPSFPARLALKDAELVLEAAERHGLVLPIAETVARQFEKAISEGHADDDMAAVYDAWRQPANR